MHASSHTKVRTTRAFGFGEDRHTVRVRQPARGDARRRAINEWVGVR